MASRIVCWREGRSRPPPVRTGRRRSKRPWSAAGGGIFMRGGGRPIAKGSPAQGHQEVGDQGRCLHYLLEVVEHEQEALVVEDRFQPFKQRLVSRLMHPKRLRNSRRHQVR